MENNVLFLVFITLVIHVVYGFVVLHRAKSTVRKQMKRYEKRLYIMAQSLYTPLSSIQNFIELLGSEKIQTDKKKMAEYRDIIDDNVIRILETLRYYIDISRLENNTFNIFVRDDSLSTIIEERLHFYGSRALRASVTLEMYAAKDLPKTVAFDSRAVSRMVDRMLSAMIERSIARDTISVRIFPVEGGKTVQDAAKNVGHTCLYGENIRPETQKMVTVSVSSSRKVFDTAELGSIIPDTMNDLLTVETKEFTAGQLLKSHHVGLAIVQRFAEAHGGSSGAWVSARGSVLYFSLPQISVGVKRLQKAAE